MSDVFSRAFELIGNPTPIFSSIVETTLTMAAISSVVSFLIGGLIGLLVAYNDFCGKRAVVIIIRTLMGLPPVGVGIILYVLFSGTGPFGSLGLIYSVDLMIVAQIVLITPIAAGMTESSVSQVMKKYKTTIRGLKLNPIKTFALVVNESKYQLVAVYLFAFARAISEVGAIQIVGGNILYKTRTMTTAIALNYNTGEFTLALSLGFILILIALAANLAAGILQWGASRKRR